MKNGFVNFLKYPDFKKLSVSFRKTFYIESWNHLRKCLLRNAIYYEANTYFFIFLI